MKRKNSLLFRVLSIVSYVWAFISVVRTAQGVCMAWWHNGFGIGLST